MILYCTDHPSSSTIMGAISEALGIELTKPPWPRPLQGPAVFYGRDRGTLDIVRQARVSGFDWWMADNGYLGRSRAGLAQDHPDRYAGFYKISKNGFQHTGRGEGNKKRFYRALELSDGLVYREKWRKRTEQGHILICPPIREYDRLHHFSTEHWIRWARTRVRTVTNRGIRMRFKPGDKRGDMGKGATRTLAQDLLDCHAVVTHDSNVVVEALLEGIDCFVTGDSPAQVFGNCDLTLLENPQRLADRHEWFCVLANNQWTLREIRKGRANHLFT